MMFFIRVVWKPQLPNNNRFKIAKRGAFCKTCERTNRVIEQLYYTGKFPFVLPVIVEFVQKIASVPTRLNV
jgi:hypothetical protein